MVHNHPQRSKQHDIIIHQGWRFPRPPGRFLATGCITNFSQLASWKYFSQLASWKYFSQLVSWKRNCFSRWKEVWRLGWVQAAALFTLQQKDGPMSAASRSELFPFTFFESWLLKIFHWGGMKETLIIWCKTYSRQLHPKQASLLYPRFFFQLLGMWLSIRRPSMRCTQMRRLMQIYAIWPSMFYTQFGWAQHLI